MACDGAETCGCVAQLVAGACLRTYEGRVYCWGGAGTSSSAIQLAPTEQPALLGAQRIAAGTSQVCAQTSASKTVCIGDNLSAAVDTLPMGVELAIGYFRSVNGTTASTGPSVCVRTAAGEVWCVDRAKSTAVQLLSDVVQLSGSDTTLCAVKRDGTLWCWGVARTFGAAVFQETPVQVPSLAQVVQVATASGYICARLADGTVHCWTPMPMAMPMPMPMPGIANAVDLALGGGGGCVIGQDGSLSCWGTQPGDGSTQSKEPIRVALPRPDEMAVGANKCVRLGARVWCWGPAPLGDGTMNLSSRPARVSFSCASP